MKDYQPIKKYETLRINDRIGPLKIPIIPTGINPDDYLPLIIEEKKKRGEKDDRPNAPPKEPPKEH